MKDREIMSVEIEVTTPNPVAFKSLSPLDKESELYVGQNGDLSDFVVQRHEENQNGDESECQELEAAAVTTVNEMPFETEDEFNKDDVNDTLIDEDKLLADIDELEADIETNKLNGDVTHEFTTLDESPTDTPSDPKITIDTQDLSPINDTTDPVDGHEESEVQQNDTDVPETRTTPTNLLESRTTPTDSRTTPTDSLESSTAPTNILESRTTPTGIFESRATPTDNKSKEEHDAELLKNQIMDTEDLLEIVEDNKHTSNELETDHEPEPDTDNNDDIDDEFDSEHLTPDDGQNDQDENEETKDDCEVTVENEDIPMSESDNIISDTGLSNENSSSGDKDDSLVIDEKSVALTDDEKGAETFEETDIELEATSLEKDNECGDAGDDICTTKLTEDIQPKTPKRTLSDIDSESERKKPKLAEVSSSEDAKTELRTAVDKIVYLDAFADFMTSKNIKDLSRSHLEEFCLQKMCEALYHKSELGELRHQLGVQEQMVEMWRKEVMQLAKQARDLEIVNKRLLHEIKFRSDREKPLIPVKITRSVGLQVRCDSVASMITPKRRLSQPQRISTVQPIAPKQPNHIVAPPLNKLTAPIPNTVKPLPPKIITSKANSLLTQALANSSIVSSATIKSPVKSVGSVPVRVIPGKPAVVSKPALPKVTTVTSTSSTKPTDKMFIDLTDEEEKRPHNLVNSSVSSTTPTTSIRFVKAAPSVVATSSVSNSSRIMYVYNNQLHQGVLATDPSKPGGQKLMLKLNSNMMGQTNGVLATVPGGSLAVSGTPLRPGQPIRLPAPASAVRNTFANSKSVLRHPAPLPPPPIAQLSIAARKPIPPRPHLTIRRSSGGIVLSWKMPYNLDNYEIIASYQLYAYQETSGLPSSDMWRKVGDVKALALPMACTLTQFADHNKYHFAVRAVDVHKRMGQFSEPEHISL